jgi:hypothetical protein
MQLAKSMTRAHQSLLLGVLVLVLPALSGAQESEAEAVNRCERMTSESYRQVCLQSAAAATGDLGLCEKMKSLDMRDTCYASVAAALRDYSICDAISADDLRNECVQAGMTGAYPAPGLY